MFYCALFASTASAISLSVGVFYFKTIESVAWCILCTFILSFVQCYALLYKKVFSHSVISFYKNLLNPILLSIISFVILWIVQAMIQDSPYLMSLVIKCIVFIIVYIIYIKISGEYHILHSLIKRN